MILWKFKEDLETRQPIEAYPCDMFRWVAKSELSKNEKEFSFSLVHQHRDRKSKKWRSSHVHVYSLTFIMSYKRWRWGSDHFYYDGPHCVWNFGPISIQWGGNWKCKKCLREGD